MLLCIIYGLVLIPGIKKFTMTHFNYLNFRVMFLRANVNSKYQSPENLSPGMKWSREIQILSQ